MKSKITVLPTRRDLKFGLPAERVHDWVDGNVHFTALMNTFSLVIPVGERFFIDAVRGYRERIADPELKKAATAFIGQEALHGREHDRYNALMIERTPAAADFERRVTRLLAWFQKNAPLSYRLSATIALEHLTAIMADGLLNEPYLIERSEPHYAAQWKWHAYEETEHKGVPFDVYETQVGRGPVAYVERATGLALATAIFWGMIIPHFLGFLRDEGKLTDLKGWRQFWRIGFGDIGFLRKMVRPWFGYFRPGFHPWDHDNSRFLAEIESFTREWEAQMAKAA
jgi:predicted metal-dependent hydrolase